jgi:hypothetical protein
MRRILVPFAASLLVATIAVGPVSGATKSAIVTLSYTVGSDGRCYPVSTASWSGYRVDHIRHIYRETGKTGYDFADVKAFDTTSSPDGHTHLSGTMVSTSNVPFFAGESWYVEALFRSKGGNNLAQAFSTDLVAPADCGQIR